MINEDIETVEETDVDTKEDTSNGKKLICHNDDITPFDVVISALMGVCKMKYEQAVQITYMIHHRGLSIVQEGSEEKLKKMKIGLEQRGIIATIED